MKENDMLEQMFSAVAQLLGQREEALLQRVDALEKRVEELEQKLQEALQAGVSVAAVVSAIEEDVVGDDTKDNQLEELEAVGVEIPVEEDVLETGEDVPDAEEVDADGFEVEEAGSGEVEEIGSEDVAGEEFVDEEEQVVEPEMEIELEFFDDEEDEIIVEEADVIEEDDDEWAEEYTEGDVEDDIVAEDEIGQVREVAESDDEEGPVLVVDKARPDWYDWEVDIPGSYIEDIWDGIGLNDRLLFLKELFRGDEIDFSETLDALNEMATLVEAVEYIRGRYSFWDEESDEVYRFYMTVRRRFNKQKQEI